MQELTPEVKTSLDQWAGCVAGTMSISEYTEALESAGFGEIDIEIVREVKLDGVDGAIASAYLRAKRPAAELAATAS